MDSNSSIRISAAIICCNEEQKIRRCLESVAFCDEIVVVDSGSTDRTLEICREFTDRIIQRPWPGHVLQKQFALEQCRGEWIFSIDSDEQVTPELRRSIEQAVRSGEMYDGYAVGRVVYFLGRFWRRGGWYPEYRIRLMRKGRCRVGGQDPHDTFLVEGKVGKLPGELHHFTYDNFEYQIKSLNYFSSISARKMFEAGRRASLVSLIGNPIVRFIKFYFLKLGCLEGIAGFVVAFHEAFYVFLKYAKLWELQRAFLAAPIPKESGGPRDGR